MSKPSPKPAKSRPAQRFQITVPLPEELHRKIHEYADAEDRSVAAVIRRMILSLPAAEAR